MEQMPSIRVYASGRQFVVVPLVTEADDRQVEAVPAHPVHLTMGRPVALALTRAIRDAQGLSRAAAGSGITAWDGEGGKWWSHHLLRATVTWQSDQITITSAPRKKANAGAPVESDTAQCCILPADTPASDIAEWLIRHLGERLHAA